MTPHRAGWWFATSVLIVELGVIGTRPQWATIVLRSVYVTVWQLLPPIDGAELPERFK